MYLSNHYIVQFTMSHNLWPPTLVLLCDELEEVNEWDKLAIDLNVLDFRGKCLN